MYMFTDTNIKKFLRSKQPAGKKVKDSYKSILTEAQALLSAHTEVTPDTQIFYHELFKDKNISDSEKQTYIERIREFINFANDTKGDNTMSENEDIMQSEVTTEAEDTVKRGRPKITDRQRKEGFNLQLEPSVRENLNILAEYDECSATEFITNLIKQAINARHEDIEYMLKIKQELRERKAQRNTTL